MKSNKRYLLVALALLLATLLISGLALAEIPADFKLTLGVTSTTKTELDGWNVGQGSWVYYFSAENEGSNYLKAAYEPTTFSLEGMAFEWTSSNEEVAWFYNETTYGSLTNTMYVRQPGETTVTVKMLDENDQDTGKTASYTYKFTAAPVTDISFSLRSLKMSLNTSFNLSDYVVVKPSTAPWGNAKYLQWSSSDDNTVAVDNKGNLTAKKVGTVTITATDKEGKKSSKKFYVTVKEHEKAEEIKSIKFSKPTMTWNLNGPMLNLANYLTIDPSYIDADDLKWTTSDMTVATLDVDGYWDDYASEWVSYAYVYFKKAGTVTITAASPDGKVKDTCTITVTEEEETKLDSLKFEQTEFNMNVGDELDLTAYLTILPEEYNYNQDDFIWTSSDKKVATVNYGWVEAKKLGTTTIKVTPKAKPAAAQSVTINVIPALESVKFVETEFSVVEGEGLNLREYLIITPDDYQYKPADFKWTSSDENVASVDNGYVETYNPGTVTIKVTPLVPEDKPAEAQSVTITVKPALKSLKFTESALSLEVNDSLNLYNHLIFTPNDYQYYPYDFKWSSSDISIATVDSYWDEIEGRWWIEVTGNKAGTATITVTPLVPKDKPVDPQSISITVTEKKATAVAFTQPSFVFNKGAANIYLEEFIQYTPVDANPKFVSFSTSNRDVLEIGYNNNNYGAGIYANANKPGTVTVTVTVKNYDDSIVTNTCTVEVKAVEVTGFAFEAETYDMEARSTGSDQLNLLRRLIVKPDDREWLHVFGDDEENLIWSTSDRTIATVSNGLVTAVAPGTATITVTYGPNPEIQKSVTVNVKGLPVTSVKLDKTTFTEEPNTENNRSITATITPANAYVKETYWKTSDKSIVTVGTYTAGTLTLLTGKAGQATLTFCVDDGTTVHEASVEVTVVRASGALKIKYEGKSVKNLTLGLQKSGNNKYRLVAADSNDANVTYGKNEVTWKSSKTDVASINKDGVLTIKKEGSTKITATLKDGSGKKATLKLTVKKNLIKKLSATKVITVRAGKELDLNEYITIKKTDKDLPWYYKKLSFSSNKHKIASVNQDGTLVANKVGTAKITVKTNDGSKKKFVITVEVKEAAEARDITITHDD